MIWNCFYQVDDQYVGIGIGFFYVKMLVELMEGWIEVESELGKGFIFFVIFFIIKKVGINV